MVWEEVTVSCMKGVWYNIWPSNENYGTNCDNLDMVITEISEITEVSLDNVDPVATQHVSHTRRTSLQKHPGNTPIVAAAITDWLIPTNHR